MLRNGRVRRLPPRSPPRVRHPGLVRGTNGCCLEDCWVLAQDDLRHSAAFLRDEKASVCKRGDAKVSGDGGIFCQHGCGAGVDERANAIKASRVSRIAPQRLFWREEILRLRSTAGAEALPQPIPAGIVCARAWKTSAACDHTAASMAPADVPLSPSRSEMRRTVHRVIAKNASNRGSAASARTSCTKRRACVESASQLRAWRSQSRARWKRAFASSSSSGSSSLLLAGDKL